MGLYSVMRSEAQILKEAENAKHILIISCPGCACESLSYEEDLPNRLLEQGKDMDASAVAVNVVRTQWVNKLEGLGYAVDYVSIVFPCEMFDTEREQILAALPGHDTVMVLACGSAYIGIRDILKDFTGRIIPMMQTKGSFVFKLVKDDTGKHSKVDRASARINTFAKTEKGE